MSRWDGEETGKEKEGKGKGERGGGKNPRIDTLHV